MAVLVQKVRFGQNGQGENGVYFKLIDCNPSEHSRSDVRFLTKADGDCYYNSAVHSVVNSATEYFWPLDYYKNAGYKSFSIYPIITSYDLNNAQMSGDHTTPTIVILW